LTILVIIDDVPLINLECTLFMFMVQIRLWAA